MLRKHPLSFLALCFALLLLFSFPAQPVSGESPMPVLVGIYPSAELYQTVNEINTLQTYMGKPTISIAGTFLNIESPNWLIIDELNAAWDNGYVPFINLGAGNSGADSGSNAWEAKDIADGALDEHIRRWARTYRTMVSDGQRRAFIAPLQEANGEWVSYGGDPANYIRAYLRIRQIFLDEGVLPNAVSWVFAPNGWHDPARPQDAFENYYPGHSAVDVVGFSSFNFGTCFQGFSSESYEQIYLPYLERMATMAPGKPIIIAEIGSVTQGVDRAAWFNDTISKIGAFPGVRGIVYFNRAEDPATVGDNEGVLCNPVDFSLDANSGEGKAAFKAQVTNPPYGYWSLNSPEMVNIAFGRPQATFEDVWPASVFSGKSTTAYYQPWVERLVGSGITGGCTSDTIGFAGVSDFTYRYYCPENPVTRAQMAVFLLKAMNYPASYSPPAAIPTFPDTNGHWAAQWIEALKDTGITSGFPDGTYRPENPVTRAQMAVFLLKAKHGTAYIPPNVGETTGFSDVPTSHWAATWIKQLAAEGITGGYPDGTYRPEDTVTRGQMSIFLVRTFELP